MEKRNLNSAVILLMCVTLMSACSTTPDPLRYGKDACHHCKMTLMDNKFGGEIVTVKGKVYKFDDVNCMMNFYGSGQVAAENIKDILIVDFSVPAKLIDAHSAVYVKSQSIKSPMASNIAAFESNDMLAVHNETWKGTILKWTELPSQLK